MSAWLTAQINTFLEKPLPMRSQSDHRACVIDLKEMIDKYASLRKTNPRDLATLEPRVNQRSCSIVKQSMGFAA